MTPDDTKNAKLAETLGPGAAQTAQPNLDCSLSVNTVLARFPSTLSVFNRFGLDTCCGGALSVADAARAADVDTEALCGALADAIAA
jgi:iron-sulfur cluster repair protein YtfE (RIC family)